MKDSRETNDAPVITRMLASAMMADDIYQNRIKNSVVWGLTTGVVLPAGWRLARWAWAYRKRRRADRKHS